MEVVAVKEMEEMEEVEEEVEEEVVEVKVEAKVKAKVKLVEVEVFHQCPLCPCQTSPSAAQYE